MLCGQLEVHRALSREKECNEFIWGFACFQHFLPNKTGESFEQGGLVVEQIHFKHFEIENLAQNNLQTISGTTEIDQSLEVISNIRVLECVNQ